MVKAAVEKQLEKRGLDERSRERFLELLWQSAESKDVSEEKKTLKAWTLLGRAFIPQEQNINVGEMQELPIKGLKQGLARMGVLNDTDEDGDDQAQSAAGFAKPGLAGRQIGDFDA